MSARLWKRRRAAMRPLEQMTRYRARYRQPWWVRALAWAFPGVAVRHRARYEKALEAALRHTTKQTSHLIEEAPRG